jgi:hypothetical protein
MSEIRRRTKRTITSSLLTVLIAAGCGNQQGSAPVAPRLPHSGAPAVTDPLTTDEFEVDPCGTVSVGDLGSLGIKVTDASSDRNPPGPTCRYRRDDALSWGLAITVITADKEGLSRLYQNERIDPAGYFQEVSSVAGYPGVLTGLIDNRANGDCDLIVGIRDDRTIQVILSGDSGGEPCRVARTVGELVVDRLKKSN